MVFGMLEQGLSADMGALLQQHIQFGPVSKWHEIHHSKKNKIYVDIAVLVEPLNGKDFFQNTDPHLTIHIYLMLPYCIWEDLDFFSYFIPWFLVMTKYSSPQMLKVCKLTTSNGTGI